MQSTQSFACLIPALITVSPLIKFCALATLDTVSVVSSIHFLWLTCPPCQSFPHLPTDQRSLIHHSGLCSPSAFLLKPLCRTSLPTSLGRSVVWLPFVHAPIVEAMILYHVMCTGFLNSNPVSFKYSYLPLKIICLLNE